MISVIIPTYQRPGLLMDRAIPSVMVQKSEWELLVVGDGTDALTVIRMEALARADKRVRFWNLPHDDYPEGTMELAGTIGPKAWGLYGLTALNFGLDHAQGEWISVLNDDDAYSKRNHELLLAEAERSGVDFVYGRSDTLKGDPPRSIGQLYGAWPPGESHITQGAYIYRRSLEFRYRRHDLPPGMNGDADMWERMREAGVTFSFLPHVIHHYYRNFP